MASTTRPRSSFFVDSGYATIPAGSRIATHVRRVREDTLEDGGFLGARENNEDVRGAVQRRERQRHAQRWFGRDGRGHDQSGRFLERGRGRKKGSTCG